MSVESAYVSEHLEEVSRELSRNIETLDTGTPLPNRTIARTFSRGQVGDGEKLSVEENSPEITEQFLKEQKNNRVESSNDEESLNVSGHLSEEKENVQSSPLIYRKGSPYKSTTLNHELKEPLDRRSQELQPVEKVEEPDKDQKSNNLPESEEPVQWKITDRSTVDLLPRGVAENENQMFTMDEDKKLVKSYFHDMLRYINNNDATLANDRDGDLAFFIKQMPEEEMGITFSQWILRKRDELKNDIQDDVKKKLERLKSEFDSVVRGIRLLDDDTVLSNLAQELELNFEDINK